MKRFLVTALVVLAGCEAEVGEDGAAAMGGMPHDMAAMVDTAGLGELPVPPEFGRGAELFAANCASCHGKAALGTVAGPPLVHIIYEPNHHADIAFFYAAERGVRAHHWGFGDMPPVEGIEREEVTEMVSYIRWLQREAGIR